MRSANDYEPLLANLARILGTEHPDTLLTRHNVALAYCEAGRGTKAIALLEPLLTDGGGSSDSSTPTRCTLDAAFVAA